MRPGRRIRARSVRLGLAFLLAGASLGCFYTSGTVNLLDFERAGLSLVKPDSGDASLRKLGRVRAASRAHLFGSCDDTARSALEKLLQKARRTGANRVTSVRFRGRWHWISEPVCRRNVNYLLLVLPAFLPVPTSVTVSGIAIYDPAFAAGDGLP